jgi:hypothetical protein
LNGIAFLVAYFIFARMRRQKLESNEAVELEVLGFVDHTHASAAELFEDLIVGDGLIDHDAKTLIWNLKKVFYL